MLLLGHIGITLGTAVLLNSVCTKTGLFPVKEPEVQSEISPEAPFAPDNQRRNKLSWFGSLASNMDIRILIIGSILPDIIDKPVGQVFFVDYFSSGRIFCHTLLFTVLIALVGLYLKIRWNKNWLLVLSFGSFMHLILDQMWASPVTLFWPVYGLTFESEDLTNWIKNILHSLITDRGMFIPELIGAAILTWFAAILIRRKKILAFLRHGYI